MRHYVIAVAIAVIGGSYPGLEMSQKEMACKMVHTWEGMASLLTLRMMILPSKTERGSYSKVSELMASAGILPG